MHGERLARPTQGPAPQPPLRLVSDPTGRESLRDTAPKAPNWAVLALLCAAQFMVVLDFSIVNVALPSIQRTFDVSQDWLQGLVSAYALTFGGFLLLGGRAADLFGRRRLFMTGLLLFAGASLLGGLAPHPGLLIAARGLQGLGAAILSPAALSLVTSLFRDGRERHRALGIYGALGAGGFAMGVFLGGLLTDGPGWRWVFFVNVPIGITAALLSPRFLPQIKSVATERGLDIPGALTGTGGLALFVLGLTEAPSWGWMAPLTWICLAVGVACLAAFVAIERRARAPILRLSIFRNRAVAIADGVALLSTACVAPQIFVLSLYLQTVEGYSAVQTGLVFLVQGASAIFGAWLGSRGLSLLGARPLLLGGRVVAAIALFVLAPLPLTGQGGYLPVILPALAVLGLANVVTFVACSVAGTSGVEPRELGLASGMLYTAQQVGSALGISVLIALATTRTAILQKSGVDVSTATIEGFRWALVGAGLISVAASIVAVGAPARTAERQETPSS